MTDQRFIDAAIRDVAEEFGVDERHIIESVTTRPYGDGSSFMIQARYAVEQRAKVLEQAEDMQRKDEALRYIQRWLDETGLADEVHPSVPQHIRAALSNGTQRGDENGIR